MRKDERSYISGLGDDMLSVSNSINFNRESLVFQKVASQPDNEIDQFEAQQQEIRKNSVNQQKRRHSKYEKTMSMPVDS